MTERELLKKISREDWTPYGSLQSRLLDSLFEKRLVRYANYPPVGNTGVQLTEQGWRELTS